MNNDHASFPVLGSRLPGFHESVFLNFLLMCITANSAIAAEPPDPISARLASTPANSRPNSFVRDVAPALTKAGCNAGACHGSFQGRGELQPTRDPDGQLCTHRVPRRLTAEVLIDAVSQVTGVPEAFDGQPLGTRAIALADPSFPSNFLMTFGRPLRNNACDCVLGGNPDLSQALHLVNSTTLHQKVISDSGRLATLLKANKPETEILDELYLATLSRKPHADKLTAIDELLREAPSRPEELQDLLWTLLNSSEFVFNH